MGKCWYDSAMSDSGRIVLHDPKSWDYEYPRRLPAFGRNVRHTMNAPNVDQFFTSGCVGFSATNMLNSAMAVRSRLRFNQHFYGRNTRAYLRNQDGLTNYSGATRNDPFPWVFPPTDEGASAIGLMKFWQQMGVIQEYRWTFTFNGFLAALQQQPVLMGTSWYRSMNNPDANGLATVSGNPVSGHEYVANQIIWNKKWVGFENSWGENWGLKGRFFLPFSEVEMLILNGGDVCVPRFL